jgi:pilus assembly protein CpaE
MTRTGLTVLLILEPGIDAWSVEGALPAGTRVQTAAFEDAAGPGSAQATDVLIVGVAHQADRALAWIASSSERQPDRPVIVLHEGNPNGFLDRAFDAGADDLITLPQSRDQLAFALDKALARRRGAAAAGRSGSMISILGPKGGTGKTLTTCNLGVALALAGHSVVMVDLDLQFGDVGLALGLRPQHTIYNLASSGGSLDAGKVEAYLTTHGSGARALLAPVRPDQAAAVGIDFLRHVFEILRLRFEYVIVDTPPAFTPEVIAAVDASTDICVVGMLDALSLKDTKIGLETLSQMGYDPKDTRLVLNRADTSVGISAEDVAALLGRHPDIRVPSDRSIPRTITEGRTIVEADPTSGAAQAFMALARSYVRAGHEVPAEAAVAERSPRRLRLPKVVR